MPKRIILKARASPRFFSEILRELETANFSTSMKLKKIAKNPLIYQAVYSQGSFTDIYKIELEPEKLTITKNPEPRGCLDQKYLSRQVEKELKRRNIDYKIETEEIV